MDLIDRQAAINAVDSETVSTNPEHFKSSEKFIKFMDDADIESFGKWQWANGFNTAVVASKIQLQKLPSAEPRQGKWIPCIEKYPDMDETVLVYTNSHEYYVWDCTSNRGDYYFWEDEKGYYHNKYEVDLWMPLPEV